MCKIAYYFLILIKFIPIWYWYFPLDLQYVFQILARLKHAYVSYSNFAKCAKRRKNKEIFFKSYLRNGWRNFLQIWNMALPWVEGTSVVNLVLFRSDIMELMKIAALFFLSICSLRLGASCFLGPHDTLLCVLMLAFLLDFRGFHAEPLIWHCQCITQMGNTILSQPMYAEMLKSLKPE